SAPGKTAARSSRRLNRCSARSARARGGLECEPHFRPKPVLGFALFDGPNEARHRGKTHASTRLTIHPYERRVRDGSGLVGASAASARSFLDQPRETGDVDEGDGDGFCGVRQQARRPQAPNRVWSANVKDGVRIPSLERNTIVLGEYPGRRSYLKQIRLACADPALGRRRAVGRLRSYWIGTQTPVLVLHSDPRTFFLVTPPTVQKRLML